MDLLGVPWAYDGRNPRTALSCYGLVLEIYSRAGFRAPSLWVPSDPAETPRFSADVLASLADSWEEIDAPQDMALVSLPSPWFSDGGHCGVYLSDGIVAHSPMKSGVIFEPWDRVRPKVMGLYRLKALA